VPRPARNPRGFQSVLINGAPNLVPLKPVDTRYQFFESRHLLLQSIYPSSKGLW